MGMKTLSWKQEGWMKEDSEKFMLIICQKLISKEPPSPHQSQNLQLKEETTTKRPHSPPSLSDNPRGTKTAKANEGSERVNSTSPSLRKKLPDRGSFSLTNARSPALTLNNKHNEFHFSPVKSTLKPKTNVQ